MMMNSNDNYLEWQKKWQNSDWYKEWKKLSKRDYQGRKCGIWKCYVDNNKELHYKYEEIEAG
jgi:sugar diacid utilization regulator